MPSRRVGPCGTRTDRRYRRARPSRRRAGSDGRCAGACEASWYHARGVAIHPDDVTIEDLVAAGRHAEAARRAAATGQHARAADLYEKLWDFRAALSEARAAGDQPRALRYALELHDEPL